MSKPEHRWLNRAEIPNDPRSGLVTRPAPPPPPPTDFGKVPIPDASYADGSAWRAGLSRNADVPNTGHRELLGVPESRLGEAKGDPALCMTPGCGVYAAAFRNTLRLLIICSISAPFWGQQRRWHDNYFAPVVPPPPLLDARERST